MENIAKRAYESLAVGETGWMRPDPAHGVGIDLFQKIAVTADTMQDEGLIQICSIHQALISGCRVIDSIQFTRVR